MFLADVINNKDILIRKHWTKGIFFGVFLPLLLQLRYYVLIYLQRPDRQKHFRFNLDNILLDTCILTCIVRWLVMFLSSTTVLNPLIYLLTEKYYIAYSGEGGLGRSCLWLAWYFENFYPHIFLLPAILLNSINLYFVNKVFGLWGEQDFRWHQ